MERNILLDYFKILLCILVIGGHMQPLLGEGQFSSWYIANGISRITVPTFLLISGYYVLSKLNDPKAFKKYIKHFITIYLVWTIIYIPYFYDSVRPVDVLIILLSGYYHLWYMPTAIVGLLMLYFSKKYLKKDSYIFILAIILYIAGYILSLSYDKIYVYRNGFTIGFMFVFIGYIIRRMQLEKKSDWYIIPLTIFALAINTYEAYYTFQYSPRPNQDMMLSILLLSPILFILIIKHPIMKAGKGFLNTLPSAIYFVHPFAISLISVPDEYKITALPLVFLLATVFSFIVYMVNKKVKIFL
ncbi:acyltransferase [Prevotella sp. 10(H)]|uniref:acyltransferase family protein n=1 Tax=Prevotella sp. 10(H) TaxID=1158294 RepID=UPI0004A71E21|nr:acyltransferase [Prevotella sp. 10(H)]